MKKFLLFSGFVAFGLFYACQKDALSSTDLTQTDLSVIDRGGDGPHGGGGHHGGGPHHGDSTHIDSTHQHPLDTLHHHHPADTLQHPPFDTSGHHHHLDSLDHPPHDTTWTHPGNGCHVPPAAITVTDLPAAAQDWLAANQPGATIEKILKFTKPDCTVFYMVKIDGTGPIRFDSDGNKVN